MSKIVIYTAITNNYDDLKPQPLALYHQANFVAFTDRQLSPLRWEIRKATDTFTDPLRNAKAHKILSHVYFPKADYSLWIDGSVHIQFCFTLQRMIREYLSDCDLAVFRHPARNCIYQEADACISARKDDRNVIIAQMKKYRRESYPFNNGLAECTVLLRRHSPDIQRFNNMWFDEVSNHSRRDQLSFNYVTHKLGLKFRYFPGFLRGSQSNGWFLVKRHQGTADLEQAKVTQRLSPVLMHRPDRPPY